MTGDEATVVPDGTDMPPQIFIVDDEAPLMDALCSTLRDEGYDTVGFTSAGEALIALPTSRCDLLLVDLNMPEMQGPDMLRMAQSLDANLVGIVMTGQGTISNAVEAMRAGALDFIVKPFRLSAILPVIARALQVRRLRVMNATLEQSVRKQARELAVANESLREANRELAAFNQSVSHDLRAPLHVLDGLAKLLLKDFREQMPPTAQQLVTVMDMRVSRMRQLVEDLMRLSSLGNQALQPQAFDMGRLARSVLDEIAEQQPDRTVDHQVEALPQAFGDEALVRQLLINLMSNAYKFTRRVPDAKIHVGSQRSDERTTTYFVRDNGVGFDMARSQGLFSAFKRLHRADQFEGTGVGLSIAERIVRRHGGRIWAEAGVGVGATFYFTLGDDPVPSLPAKP